MNIQGPGQIHGPQGINAPHFPRLHRPAEAGAPAGGGVDRVEISPEATAAIEAAESGQVRHDLVNRLRAEIADGSYETPARLDAALDRLLDELG